MISDQQACPESLDVDLPLSRLSLFTTESISLSQVQRLSPSALAYLGDVVYELHVRCYHLFPPKRLETYHRQVVAQVRAESQAQQLRSLEPYLTVDELDLLKRGRNAASGRPKRLDPDIYQRATGLETLIGYLYLTDLPRLEELLSYLKFDSSSETL